MDGMAMTLRLTDEEQEMLKAMAEQEGLSQQEIVRRAVRERAERQNLQRDVHAAGVRAVTRYAALLDRLSK
jgi:predicted transcriptional regulator